MESTVSLPAVENTKKIFVPNYVTFYVEVMVVCPSVCPFVRPSVHVPALCKPLDRSI